jgi:hypothetical protein
LALFFNPSKFCSEYILQASVIRVIQLDRIVAESEKIAASKSGAGIAQQAALTSQELFAVAR